MMSGNGISQKRFDEYQQKAFDVAQEQFVLGLETGETVERNRLTSYLLDMDIIRESLFSTEDAKAYVAMDTDGKKAIELNFNKDF